MRNPINWIKAKKFNSALSKYDKVFSDYESVNIDLYNHFDAAYSDQLETMNTRWFAGRSKIFERGFSDLSPTEAVAAGYTREEMIIHGKAAEALNETPPHPWCKEMGLSAKIAAKFEDSARAFAEKYPVFKRFADKVSETANNGRLPLTADSAAMLRITCDKKYYNDMRSDTLTAEEKAVIAQNYEKAKQNIITLAERDGVNLQSIDRAMTAKIKQQARVDKDMKIMYPDYSIKGFNAGKSGPAEPKSVEDLMTDYVRRMTEFDAKCKTPTDYKRNHKRPEYKDIKAIALESAKADNPYVSQEELGYMFDRANVQIANARLAKTGQPLMQVPPAFVQTVEVTEPVHKPDFKESVTEFIDKWKQVFEEKYNKGNPTDFRGVHPNARSSDGQNKMVVEIGFSTENISSGYAHAIIQTYGNIFPESFEAMRNGLPKIETAIDKVPGLCEHLENVMSEVHFEAHKPAIANDTLEIPAISEEIEILQDSVFTENAADDVFVTRVIEEQIDPIDATETKVEVDGKAVLEQGNSFGKKPDFDILAMIKKGDPGGAYELKSGLAEIPEPPVMPAISVQAETESDKDGNGREDSTQVTESIVAERNISEPEIAAKNEIPNPFAKATLSLPKDENSKDEFNIEF